MKIRKEKKMGTFFVLFSFFFFLSFSLYSVCAVHLTCCCIWDYFYVQLLRYLFENGNERKSTLSLLLGRDRMWLTLLIGICLDVQQQQQRQLTKIYKTNVIPNTKIKTNIEKREIKERKTEREWEREREGERENWNGLRWKRTHE